VSYAVKKWLFSIFWQVIWIKADNLRLKIEVIVCVCSFCKDIRDKYELSVIKKPDSATGRPGLIDAAKR
jgi:hypothetical protein